MNTTYSNDNNNNSNDEGEEQEFLELISWKQGTKLGIEILISLNNKYAYVDKFCTSSSLARQAGVDIGDIIARINDHNLINNSNGSDIITILAKEISNSNGSKPLVVWFLRPPSLNFSLSELLGNGHLYNLFIEFIKTIVKSDEVVDVVNCYIDSDSDINIHGDLQKDFLQHHYNRICADDSSELHSICYNQLLSHYNQFIMNKAVNGYLYESSPIPHIGISHILGNESYLCYFYISIYSDKQ